MFIDFDINNTEIININFNDDYNQNDNIEIITIKTNLKIYTLTAVGDCCSYSIFKEYKNYSFKNLIGKIIKSFTEIEIDDNYNDIYDNENDNYDNILKIHLYKITFKNTDDIFLFTLINYSNGYYDGWIDIKEED